MTKNRKSRRTVKNYPFWGILDNFFHHLEALNKAVLTTTLMGGIYKAESEKVLNYIKRKGKNIKQDGDTFKFTFKNDRDSIQYKKLLDEQDNSAIAYRLIPEILFVSKVTQFDLFIGALIKLILNTQSNIISPEKQLTFKDLKNFSTIKEAINYLIDKEIDSLLFDSHTAHLEWIGKKLAIDIKRELSLEWPTFAELTERRNLYIHANGIVDEHYISICKENGYGLDDNCKKGTRLKMNPEYFQQSSECLYRISTKLTFILWCKLIPKEKEVADVYFNNEIVINLIKKKKYKLAEDLLAFAESFFTESEDRAKRVVIINMALVKKLSGQKEKALGILNSKDWSSCGNDFELVIALLNDNYSNAFKLMRKIGKKDKFIDEDSYLSDPIFSDLRKHPGFPQVYKKVFGKKFVIEKSEKIELKLLFKEKEEDKIKTQKKKGGRDIKKSS